MPRKKMTIRYIGMVALAGLLMVVSYAFTASNTVPETKAGSGAGAVTGYTVSEIHYVLGATPTSFASLTFNVLGTVATGSTLKVSVAPGSWADCTAGAFTAGKTLVTCSSVTSTVVALSNLEVVAAD